MTALAVRWRVALLAGLLACFAGQTWLVYSDPTGRQMEPLSAQAQAGRKVWHDNNCQACHQLYGFGGFLGPDLTNAAPRLDRARVTLLLTEGSKQMPAFHLEEAEIDQLIAFLGEVDRTGVGQARRPSPALDAAALAEYAQRADLTPSQRRGADRFTSVCIACHTPLSDNLIGGMVAPDPSGISGRLTPAEIALVLRDGRPARGMPGFGLEGQAAKDVAEFLDWLGRHGDELEQLRDADGGDSVPWFEYE